jgi:signal transduction histidine kinase
VNLQRRTLYSIGIALILLQLMVMGVGGLLARDGLTRSEQITARQMLNVGEKLLNEQVEELERRGEVISVWDDTYRFLKDPQIDASDREYLGANFTPEVLNGTFDLSFIILLDNKKQILFELFTDGAAKPQEFPGYLREWAQEELAKGIDKNHAHLFAANGELWVFIVQLVVRSDGSGSSTGFLLAGKQLGDELSTRILGYLTAISPVNPNFGEQVDQMASVRIAASDAPRLDADQIIVGDVVIAERFMKNIEGSQQILLQIKKSSSFSLFVLPAVILGGGLVLLNALVFGLVVYRQLNALVLKPLGTLSKEIEAIDERQDTSQRVTITAQGSQDDEISTVAKAINELLSRSEGLRTELKQAVANTETALASKTQFLSRVSHELRTPMNGVLGFAQLLEFEALSPSQQDHVNQIRRSGQHLLGLINDLLDINQADVKALGLSLEPVNWRDVVQECLDMVSVLAQHHNTIIVQQVEPERYSQADRRRLKQVILNLVSNAIKYSDHHEGRVLLSLEAMERNGIAGHRLSVRDNGPGLSAEQQKRLFTPFDRLGAEMGRIEGTGLGLVLTKYLVEAMQGEIGVQSEPGKGSSFMVWLPYAESPSISSTAVVRKAAMVPTPVKTTAARVLYIEDNPANRQLVAAIIRQRPSIELVLANSGQDGLSVLKHGDFDLLLLDLHLPDLSGQAILAHIRRDARLKSMPVVVVSADATPENTQALLAAGAQDYLSKPFEVAALLEIIDRLG